ncbi:hypothetical protein RHOSPDRAFT_37441 [Rhodotorula sp. JG-1b]|nr:hypothetical protein RHOSPDRAFT_37441 [Rhodotorula sp. JG-1b]
MASTSAASGSAQMTLDQLVQRAQSTSTSHNEFLQLLKKFGKASSASSSTGQAQSGPAAAAAAGTRASASSSSNGATTTTQAAGAGAQGGASQGTPAPAAAAAPSHSLDGRLQDGSDPLRVLDPSLHSLAYLYILNARLGGTRPDWTELGPLVQAWCETCDVEVARSVPDQVLHLASQLCMLAEASNQLSLPLQPLNALLARYPLPGHLTALHPLFLRVVMASQLYPVAHEVLSRDITDVDKSLFPIRYQDHLLYHYLGGTILALLGDYTRAASLLETCVSAPGSHASMIQVDAHKKLVLVQLLAFGKVQSLPRYTSQAVSQAIKVLSAPYAEYASAFRTLDRLKVAAAVEKGRDVFARDLNLGLVSLCEDSLRRRQIQNLTETYLTLSLGAICSHVGMDAAAEKDLKEVETEIGEMISNRQIYATLTAPAAPSSSSARAETIVTFSDDPESYLSHETVARVTRAIENAQQLEKKWGYEADKLEASREFVQKAWSTAATGPASGVGGGAGAAAGSAGFPGMGGALPGFPDDIDYGSYSPHAGGDFSSWMDRQDDYDMDSE